MLTVSFSEFDPKQALARLPKPAIAECCRPE